MSQTTIRDLAQSLGLGKSTVQRALAGSPLVSPSTRGLVQAAARRGGYRHDVYFAALSAKRHRKGKPAGILIHYLYGSPFFPDYHQGINSLPSLREIGLEMGFDVEPVKFHEFPNVRTIPKALYERGSKGLIIGQTDPVLHQALLGFGKLPVLCCQRQGGLPFHTVRFAASDRVRMCWKKLWEAGYRRIGCAVMRHDPILDDDRDRHGTSLVLAAENQRPRERVPVLRSELDDEQAYLSWLKSYQPDAVISFRGGVWPLQEKAGLGHVPLVSLHASLEPGVAHIPGTLQHLELLASETLRQMDSMVRHGDTGTPRVAVNVIIEPEWHEGAGIPTVA